MYSYSVLVLVTLTNRPDDIKPSTVSGTGGRGVAGEDGRGVGREGGSFGCD